MTLKQIRDDILGRVGTDHEVSNSQINNFINEGKGRIESYILSEQPNYFPDTETLSFSSTETFKSLTKNWTNITLIQIDYGEGAGYQTSAKAELERVLDANNSSLDHCVWGTTLYLTNTSKAATVRVFGYVAPSDLSGDGDEPMFDKLLHPLISIWGVGCMLETMDEDYVGGKRKKDEFESALENIGPTVVKRDSTNITNLI